MAIKLRIDAPGGQNTYAVQISDVIGVAVHDATAQTIVPPAGAKYALFSSTGDFYWRDGATAVVPVATGNSGASELNPVARVISGANLSLIGASGVITTVSFYE